MKCKNCGEQMESKGLMHSGNSKYQIWKCKACDKEDMECIGLNQ